MVPKTALMSKIRQPKLHSIGATGPIGVTGLIGPTGAIGATGSIANIACSKPRPRDTMFRVFPLLNLASRTRFARSNDVTISFDPNDFTPPIQTRLLILQPTPFCNIDCDY